VTDYSLPTGSPNAASLRDGVQCTILGAAGTVSCTPSLTSIGNTASPTASPGPVKACLPGCRPERIGGTVYADESTLGVQARCAAANWRKMRRLADACEVKAKHQAAIRAVLNSLLVVL
jgi:hypothetical protein